MGSAALRSTPNLIVPSSQNTAPVLEFRCLYTHDLRRKSKRWQDGFLRFHTFNKRVMVYDVPRNFIGDTHRRDEGSVQDGDELELEKGVLVQVGEGMGSMEQDLTGLFEKRKINHEQTPARPAILPTPAASTRGTPAAPLTQLRPKSLNALLGTPRGPHGRAILPTLSPFEQRHEAYKCDDREEGWPPKRQKHNPVSMGAETQQSPSLTRVRTSHQNRKTLTAAASDVVRSATRQHKQRQPEVIEVDSSDDEPSRQEHNLAGKPLNPHSKLTKVAKKSSPPPLFCPSSPSVSTTNHLSPVRQTTSMFSESLAEDPSARTTTSRSAGTEELAPVNPLRLAARKPRKKLMYKDLLPSKPPPSRDQAGDAASRAITTSCESSKHARPPQPPPDELSTFHQAQRERLKARMTRQRKIPNLSPLKLSQISYGDDLGSFRDGSQDLANTMSPPAVPAVPPRKPSASGPSTKTAEDATSTNDTDEQPPKTTLTANNLYGFTRKTTSKPKPTSNMDLTTMDQRLLAPLPINRLLRRSNSAPDKPTIPTRPPPPRQPPDKLPIDQDGPHQAGNLPRKKSPLKNWTSLPAKPVAVPITNMAKGIEKVLVVDSDMAPWSREAFDLFGWRPPD